MADLARRRRLQRLALAGSALVAAAIGGANLYVIARGASRIVEPSAAPRQTVLILGAAVHRDGTLSMVLRDRLDTALDLYHGGLASKLLVSGDHRRHTYNEVAAMSAYLKAAGVPDGDIVIDHAGFDTYSSMYRAKHVFGAEKLTIVTQRFHLTRSLYLAQSVGLDAVGVIADRHNYHMVPFREVASRCKALLDVARNRLPMFPGPPEPGLL